MAAVRAIAALAREEVNEVAAKAIGGETPVFGPSYLIPSPLTSASYCALLPLSPERRRTPVSPHAPSRIWTLMSTG
jgi:hypothetical protein